MLYMGCGGDKNSSAGAELVKELMKRCTIM